MRLWSIHPKYLDQKGLTACWREGLLAKKVLQGETRGYKNHPQLERFKNHVSPIGAIKCYLHGIWEESRKRGYNFNYAKLELTTDKPYYRESIIVTSAQIDYEFEHLQLKLLKRDYNKCYINEMNTDWQRNVEPHPIFRIIEGKIESWEKIPKEIKNV